MIDKNAIEKALLLGVVKNKNWNTLILNGITEQYFSANNKSLYHGVFDFSKTKSSQYDELMLYQTDVKFRR